MTRTHRALRRRPDRRAPRSGSRLHDAARAAHAAVCPRRAHRRRKQASGATPDAAARRPDPVRGCQRGVGERREGACARVRPAGRGCTTDSAFGARIQSPMPHGLDVFSGWTPHGRECLGKSQGGCDLRHALVRALADTVPCRRTPLGRVAHHRESERLAQAGHPPRSQLQLHVSATPRYFADDSWDCDSLLGSVAIRHPPNPRTAVDNSTWSRSDN